MNDYFVSICYRRKGVKRWTSSNQVADNETDAWHQAWDKFMRRAKSPPHCYEIMSGEAVLMGKAKT